MALTILQSDTPLQSAARSLETQMKKAKGRVLLLFSGGSATSILEHLTIPDPRYTTLGLIDERYTIDIKDQNITTLLEYETVMQAQDKGMKVFSILDKTLEMEECEEEYERKLRIWKTENPNGTIIAVLGIGEDGHTAGIMPHPEHPELFSALFEREKWVVGYNAGEKSAHSLRITVTNTFLRRYVDTAVVYVSGQKKKEPLAHLMLPFGTLTYTPARIMLQMKQVYVYTNLVL